MPSLKKPFVILHLLSTICYLLPAICSLLFAISPTLTYAQSVKSNCVITKIGNPQGPTPTPPPDCTTGGDLIGYTTLLANALIKACPPGNTDTVGHVNFNTNGCQNKLIGAFEKKVIDQYQNMPLQCIMFIYGISLHFNKPLEMSSAADEAHAQQYYDFIPASSGIANLHPGDFMVWSDSGGEPGHIAEVTTVDTTANAYTIIDANWDFDGSIESHAIPFTPQYGIITMSGWLRMK